MNFPRHDIGLIIYHNENKARNLTAEQQIEHWIDNEDPIRFETNATMQRSIDTNELWEMQWSTINSDVLFMAAAPTGEELLIYCENAEMDLSVKSEAIEADDLLSRLPGHQWLELSHNIHKLQDLSVGAYFETNDHIGQVLMVKSSMWRPMMIGSDEIWEMSWTTPDGRRKCIVAPSLPELLDFGQEIDVRIKQQNVTSLLKSIKR